MKSEKEKSGRFLIVAIFFLLLISTAQGAWDNDDLMYAKGTSWGQLTVHNIDTGEDFETIQAAIDDPDTKDGHTISVDAGNYPKPGTDPKPVVINKQLKLIGENKDNTIIDGDGSGNCIKVTADNVEISGFTIKNGKYGVYLEASNCHVIDNNIASIDFDGIFLSNSVNNTIAHNSISKVKRIGIRLSSSCNNRIHDNDLSGNDKGIVLFASPDNTIYHNNFIDNRNQAKDNRDTNRWDNGPEEGGNYWSDHKCTGNPSDGSQPYKISVGGAKDTYPFMDEDGWTCTLPSPPTLADPGTNDTDGNYTVSWSSVSSATNYTLEEDTSSSFSSPTKIYSGSGTSKEITGKSDGTYYYQVKARNECGWSKWSNKEDIKIKIDTIPPVIYHENITNATGGESIPISATITDSTTKVANATLFYRIRDSEEAWITISMDHVGDNYSATIPASHVTTAGVEYYIEAVDDASNTAFSPATAPTTPYSIAVRGESSVTISAVPSTINLLESVNISGIISRAHSANVTLTFTTPNNATQKNSTTSTPNGSYYFVFQPEEVGKWTVNATWAGDSDIAGNTSKTVSFTVNPDKVGYAIIIAGSKDGNVSDAIDRSAKNTYSVLLNNCSFTPERIFYLNSSRRQEVNGDDKDYVAKKISPRANSTHAIETWAAQDKVSANAPLLIYMVGNIENDTFFVNGTKDTLNASDLNKSLNNLANKTKCDNITVVCEACNSGNFIDDLSCNHSYNLSSQRGRIIITSTDVYGSSLFCGERGGEFSYCFFDNISSGISIKNAFENASNSTEIRDYNKLLEEYNKLLEEQRFLPQTPWLDDNGDGNGSARPLNGTGDGSLAAFRHIGTQGNGHSYNNRIPAIRLEGV